MTTNLGNFGRHVLLSGAGWSRNWGGRLASEVWQSLMDHPLVQGNARLRELLLAEPSFEVALGAVQRTPYSAEDWVAFEQALVAAFISIDREISRLDHFSRINIYGVQKFLFRFSQRRQGVDTGYLFTLNQDLWLERFLYNEHTFNAPSAALPGLQSRPGGQGWFRPDIGPYSELFTMSPMSDLGAARLQGQTNVIKLHGSFNWRTDDARNLMVVGTEKSYQIANLLLLSWYADLFKRVLNSGERRLMIIGYSFADEHINAIIADAITNHGLRVFIWDVASDLRERVFAAPHGPTIWKGLISTASRQFAEVFPGSQDETEEYRRICASFFDAN
jgi:SIR2-like domain